MDLYGRINEVDIQNKFQINNITELVPKKYRLQSVDHFNLKFILYIIGIVLPYGK